MADLVITAASVAAYDGATKETGVAGEAISIGHAVYKKTSDQRWYKSDNDAAETADDYGIALSQAAGAAQPVVVQTGGEINPGAALTVGTLYGVGAAAGGIAPMADVTAGKYPRLLGGATTATKLKINKFNLGVAQA